MPAPQPIIVISDLHLGREGMVLAAEELEPLIREAGILIVNGDTAELHVSCYRQRAIEELDRFRALCLHHGTRLILLAGNHDPTLVQQRYIINREQGIFITHGDVIDEAVAPWSDAARRMRRRHREFIDSTPASQRHSMDTAFNACREAAVAEWDPDGDAGMPSTAGGVLLRPMTICRILGFWGSQARRINDFAARYVPESRLLLIGHSHRQRIRRFADRVVVNTGCYGFPGQPRAGIFDADGFHVRAITRQDGAWTLGPKRFYEDRSLFFDAESLDASEFGPSASATPSAADTISDGSTPVLHPASRA